MTDDVIQVPFAGGPNESVAQAHLPPGSVIAATNQVYDQDGAYLPRFGYTRLGSGSPPSTIKRVAVFVAELLAVAGASFPTAASGTAQAQLFTYDGTAQAWAARDLLPTPGVTHRPLLNTTTSFLSWDEAVGNGYRVVSWIDSDKLARVAVYSVSTGACVLGPTALSNSQQYLAVRAGVVGTTAVLATSRNQTPQQIDGWTVTLSGTPSVSASPIRIDDSSDLGSGGIFGFDVLSSTTFAVAYETGTTGDPGFSSNVRIRSWDVTLSTTSFADTNVSSNAPPDLTTLTIRVDQVNGIIWVGVVSVGGVSGKLALMFAASASTLAATTAIAPIPSLPSISSGIWNRIGIDTFSNTQCVWVIDTFTVAASVSQLQLTAYGTFSTGGAFAATSLLFNVDLAAGPLFVPQLNTTLALFRYGDPQHTSTMPGTYVLADLMTANLASAVQPQQLATLAPNQVNFPESFAGYAPRFRPVAGMTFETVVPVNRTGARQGLELFTLDFGASYRWSGAFVGREKYLSGSVYDGVRAHEVAFPWAPLIPDAPTPGSGGGGAFNGSYTYVATYVQGDAAGNIDESAPSPPVTVTATSGTGHISVDVTCLTITRRQRTSDAVSKGPANPVYIRLYRQRVATSGDPLFYLVSADPLPSTNQNSLTASIVTISDSTTDGVLGNGSRPILYTMSGELQHDTPETFTHVIAHKNRIWGIGADQRTIWYSQQYTDGLVPAFSAAAIVTVDDTDEPLVGLASLYDKLLIFTKTRVYVVFGDGPAINGTGNDLTIPQRVPSDAGCIDPRSIVQTKLGVFFQSSRGLELIDPSLGHAFAGLPISVTTAAFPVCTSAAYDQAASTVRWSFVTHEAAPDDGATGVVVLYDLRRERWAVHQLTAGGHRGTVAGAPVVGAAYHPTLGYCAAWNDDATGAQAILARENTSADATPWVDFGSFFVPLSVTMAWIKSGDLQGWQAVRRIYALAQYLDAHGLTIALDYDYVATGEAHVWTSAQIAALILGTQEQVRIIPAQRQCEAVRVTVTTTAPTSPQVIGTGHGAGLLGVALEIHRARGARRRFSAGATQ